MPTNCTVNRCVNNSTKGYAVFCFPKHELCKKWIAALGKSSDWRPTASHRICEVHFNIVDIEYVAGRKQLHKNAIPCHFCTCPYKEKQLKITNRVYSKTFKIMDHAYCLEDPAKKSLPLQFRSNNILPHSYIPEHNYFAYSGKENKKYFVKKVSSNAKKKLGLINGETNAIMHVDHCPSLKSPISIKQLLPESNIDVNQNELSMNMNQDKSDTNENESDISSRQSLVSKIDALLKENENLNFKLNERQINETNIINSKNAKLNEVIAENKYLKKQLEKLNQQVTKINSSADKLTSRPNKYSNKSIIRGLSLWTASGTSRYDRIRKTLDVELPAPRTLQRRIKNILFDPGILQDIFLCLENRINNMEEKSKLCCLVFDEMSIESKIEYDPGSDSNMGYCTLPVLPIEASKALLFLVAGVYKRYKQVLAYHFTSNSTNSATVKDFILTLLEKCETSGLHVFTLVCDMGNRGILNQLGFSCRKNNIQYSIQHPFNEKQKLFALPDVVHVFKNMKEMLMKIGIITLPLELVREYGLSTGTINMNLIEWLDEEQSNMSLKFAPKLKKKNIRTNHFNKMKVSTATSVLNEQTASALFRFSELYQDPVMKTTGWFILILRHWFKIMTSRDRRFALSFHNMDAYITSIKIIQLVSNIFKNAVFEEKWKVTRSHVIMCCDCILEIQNYLLQERCFEFVYLGNLTQDSVENKFSQIRSSCPKPTARDFKYRLKNLSVSGEATRVSNSSYDYDDSPTLISLIQRIGKPNIEQTSEISVELPKLQDCSSLSLEEEEILYKMCGYILRMLQPNIKCKLCYNSLLHQGPVQHPKAGLLLVCEFVQGALVRVSDEVYQILHGAESIMVASQNAFKDLRGSLKHTLECHLMKELSLFPLSTCHDQRKTLISRFLSMRLHQLLPNQKSNTSTAFSSKSMGSRLLADSFNPRSK